MLKVSTVDAISPFLQASAQADKARGTPFREVLASVQSTAASDTAASNSTTSNADAAAIAALSAALSQFGISVPPALRISSGADGLQLSGDSRNAKFQAMLQANPALQTSLSSELSSAAMARKSAITTVANDFAGKNPGSGATAFLKDFMRDENSDEGSDAFSISFSGSKLSVDEMGKNGWEPVKDAADFRQDLLVAYTKYLLTHEVTVEKSSDGQESDADRDFRTKLAKAATEDAAAVS